MTPGIIDLSLVTRLVGIVCDEELPFAVLLGPTEGARSALLVGGVIPRINAGESFPLVYFNVREGAVATLERTLRDVACEGTPLPGSEVLDDDDDDDGDDARDGGAVGHSPAQQGRLRAVLERARKRAGMPLWLIVDRAEALLSSEIAGADRRALLDLIGPLCDGRGPARVLLSMTPELLPRLAEFGAPAPRPDAVTRLDGECEEDLAGTIPMPRLPVIPRRAATMAVLIGLCLGALFARSSMVHFDLAGERVVVKPGLAALHPFLGTDRVLVDTDVRIDQLSPAGRAAVRARSSMIDVGGGRERRWSARIEGWLVDEAVLRATSRERRWEDSADASVLLLGRPEPRLLEALRGRLRDEVERLRGCGNGAPDCELRGRDASSEDVAAGLARMAPRDPVLGGELKAIVKRTEPSNPGFRLALRVLAQLDAVGDDEVLRLLDYLSGSDLGSRQSAMQSLSTIRIANPLLRARVLEKTLTWIAGERPDQDFLTAGSVTQTALALALAIGQKDPALVGALVSRCAPRKPGLAPFLPACEALVRLGASEAVTAAARVAIGAALVRPPRLQEDGRTFYFDDETLTALAILRRFPFVADAPDPVLRGGIDRLAGSTVGNLRRFIAGDAKRFHGFFADLVHVALAEGLDGGKLVFAVFDAEGDFSGSDEDDPVLIAVAALLPKNPLGESARDLVRSHLRREPPKRPCGLESLALSLGMSDAALEERYARCDAWGDAGVLALDAARHLRADESDAAAIGRLWRELYEPAAEQSASRRRVLETALVLVARRIDGAGGRSVASLRSRLVDVARGTATLHHRISANRMLAHLEPAQGVAATPTN